MPGAPQGRYVRIDYESQFAIVTLLETVVIEWTPRGRRAAMYGARGAGSPYPG